MYNQFYGLRENPFEITPDPDFLFLSENHREALAHLIYSARERKGFTVITGEVGTGKTTLVQAFLGRLDGKVKTAYIFNPKLTSIDFLRYICEDFGLKGEKHTKGQYVAHLHNFLLDRYSRNMLLSEVGEEGQIKLMNAKVLLVGAGGLASSAALYLAASGVGTIGIADFDRVELSNLNRQVIHGTTDVGSLKVDSAKSAIERINPDVHVMTFPTRLEPANVMQVVSEFDVIMDACDNLETKFLLNDACFFAGKPYVFGGAVGFDGQAGVFWPKVGGPCLRCLFPKPPPAHLTPT